MLPSSTRSNTHYDNSGMFTRLRASLSPSKNESTRTDETRLQKSPIHKVTGGKGNVHSPISAYPSAVNGARSITEDMKSMKNAKYAAVRTSIRTSPLKNSLHSSTNARSNGHVVLSPSAFVAAAGKDDSSGTNCSTSFNSTPSAENVPSTGSRHRSSDSAAGEQVGSEGSEKSSSSSAATARAAPVSRNRAIVDEPIEDRNRAKQWYRKAFFLARTFKMQWKIGLPAENWERDKPFLFRNLSYMQCGYPKNRPLKPEVDADGIYFCRDLPTRNNGALEQSTASKFDQAIETAIKANSATITVDSIRSQLLHHDVAKLSPFLCSISPNQNIASTITVLTQFDQFYPVNSPGLDLAYEIPQDLIQSVLSTGNSHTSQIIFGCLVNYDGATLQKMHVKTSGKRRHNSPFLSTSNSAVSLSQMMESTIAAASRSSRSRSTEDVEEVGVWIGYKLIGDASKAFAPNVEIEFCVPLVKVSRLHLSRLDEQRVETGELAKLKSIRDLLNGIDNLLKDKTALPFIRAVYDSPEESAKSDVASSQPMNSASKSAESSNSRNRIVPLPLRLVYRFNYISWAKLKLLNAADKEHSVTNIVGQSQLTETANVNHCPLCYGIVFDLLSLMGHLRHCHPRLDFVYRGDSASDSELPVIDVYPNFEFDASVELDQSSQRKQRKADSGDLGPKRKLTFTQTILTMFAHYLSHRHYRLWFEIIYISKFAKLRSDALRKRRAATRMQEYGKVVDCRDPERPKRGHYRGYFHSRTLRPIDADDIDNDDSEDGGDVEWRIVESDRLLSQYTDLNDGEMEMMKLWNAHIIRHPCLAVKRVADSLHQFLDDNFETIKKRRLTNNALMHVSCCQRNHLINRQELLELCKRINGSNQ